MAIERFGIACHPPEEDLTSWRHDGLPTKCHLLAYLPISGCQRWPRLRSGVTNLTAVALIFGFLFVLPVFIGYRTGHLLIAMPVAILATAGVFFWVWSSLAETETLEAIVAADGNNLVLSYYGGDCEDQRSVSVDEDDETVRVSVTSRSFASGCNDMAVLRRIAVTLEHPLGTRAVVDLGCTRDRSGCERTLTPLPPQ